MADTNIASDFITVDGGNGGSGATYYELAESVGLPAFRALPLVDDLLKKYGIRDKTYIIASGQLVIPDKIAITLALGAGLINIAREFMLSVGCIMAKFVRQTIVHSESLQQISSYNKGLNIEEKKYRACNYVVTMRQGIFEMTAVAGIGSPTKFNRKHLVYKDEFNQISGVNNIAEGIK